LVQVRIPHPISNAYSILCDIEMDGTQYSDKDPDENRMYVLMCPCISDPSLRADGITTSSDRILFSRCIERCRQFGIEVVHFPCLETLYLGKGRKPGCFLERMNKEDFFRLLDEKEEAVRNVIAERGEPLAIIGADSSPTCGVNHTYYGTVKQPGRGVFLSRFSEIRAIDVKQFARYRVYLAAPLFTEAEQNFNRLLQNLLTKHLFKVYLPQEVGDTSHTREKEEHMSIFRQHIRALRESDLVVAVVDGADADSGTSWEMGYAYALEKPIIALRTDFRCAGHYELVNLMLEESSKVVTKKEDLPKVLNSPFH
jgi:nucleoside 2-deoxyribosyltransferase